MENSNASTSEHWETTDSEDDSIDTTLSDRGNNSGSHESETLSDIDDAEVGRYINNEKEIFYKKKIWEMMNKDYLQNQEARKTLAASKIQNPKGTQRCKAAKDVKKAQSNAGTAQPTSKKRASSRINYDALNNLCEEPELDENAKRTRTESESTGNQADDVLEEADETETEQNEWGGEDEEFPSHSYYDDQDDYYGFDDEENLF